MQYKRLIMVAAMVACSTTFAQSSVNVYGLIDLSLDHYTSSAGSVTRLASGQDSGSRVGFKGSEDLGGGLSAIFRLEAGFNADSGAGSMPGGGIAFSRESYIGLKGNWGQLVAGRVWTPSDDAWSVYRWNNYAAFIFPEFGNFDRFYSNSLKYVSPKIGGFQATGMYSFGEVAGSTKANRATELGLTYEAGPVGLYTAYNVTENAAGTASDKVYSLAGSYALGPVLLRAAYLRGQPRAAGLNDATLGLLGFDYNIAPNATLAADFQRRSVSGSDQGSDVVRLMANYSLSKRTSVYAIAARLSNRGGDFQSFAGTLAPDAGQTGLTLGLKHSF